MYDDEDEMVNDPMDGDYIDDSDEISAEAWQEACWVVISAYFDEKVFLIIKS